MGLMEGSNGSTSQALEPWSRIMLFVEELLIVRHDSGPWLKRGDGTWGTRSVWLDNDRFTR